MIGIFYATINGTSCSECLFEFQNCDFMSKMSTDLRNVRPMFDLRGRNYIVTGGAQGIGFAVTQAICEMGGNVAVLDIQESPIPEFYSLGALFGLQPIYIRTDVRDENSINQAFEKVLQAFETLHGLVPAAGIAIDKPFVEQTWDEFTRIQEINVSSNLC